MDSKYLNQSVDVLIVGGGPAGLMAATELIRYKCTIRILDTMPSVGRKFLMAGKSGLNITSSNSDVIERYGEFRDWIEPIIEKFGPNDIMQFCQSLGQEIIFGSSGKVFPKCMKSSPLLRVWLTNLVRQGVEIHTSSRWLDFDKKTNSATKNNRITNIVRSNNVSYPIISKATILALGGASWSRLGSDGKWYNILRRYLQTSKNSLVPFAPANAGFKIRWSRHMMKFEGIPVKSVTVKINGIAKKGEFVVTRTGIEGGVIYLFSTMEKGETDKLEVDLMPDVSLLTIAKKLDRNSRKSTLTNFLRKSLGLTGVKFALLREFAYPYPETTLEFARIIKNLELRLDGNYSIDFAISTKGGVATEAVNNGLMLYDLPNVFCAGEMLNWSAPTGGYLLTGCFATGSHVGKSVAKYLNLKLIA